MISLLSLSDNYTSSNDILNISVCYDRKPRKNNASAVAW